MKLEARPLTADSSAPYGSVVMASPRGEPGRPVNQGTARRFDHLAAIDNQRPESASLNVSVFRCAPRVERPIVVALLEKHPRSTQLFVPMNARRYLVIVARGGDAPDLATLAAFIAGPTQAVSYHPGVWHHPMIALDHEIDFTCLVWEDGSADDCSVVTYEGPDRPEITLDR